MNPRSDLNLVGKTFAYSRSEKGVWPLAGGDRGGGTALRAAILEITIQQ
jgi:hypothetical protein